MPSFVGGGTVPHDRTDLAVGAAVRVPVGGLVPEGAEDVDAALGFGAPGGVAPVALVRHGVTDDVDLGVTAAGSSLHAPVRAQLALGGSSLRLVAGLAPHVGVVHDEGAAARFGATLPIGFAFDALSILSAWLAARVGVEHVTGELGADDAARSVALTGVRTGGVVGLAVGFRRLHVLVELGVDHERWLGDLADNAIDTDGIVLTPAFAVRLRL
ncbi:MAG TPA: hypothetical protein RMH99_28205 [Sandaracinaceae bacterium LLY-WYZ-13_1]|nr:hypothetical protein [Sandaracinaceae bacterium LLY-WYZ-13_1]